MRKSGNLTQWSDGYPSDDVILRDISKGWSRVMEDEDGRIFATFCMMTEAEPTYREIRDGAWDNDRPYFTIHRVASDGSRPGVFRAACEYAGGLCKELRVDTHADNLPMRKAILAEGFSRRGVITLADGTDRTAFSKSLL